MKLFLGDITAFLKRMMLVFTMLVIANTATTAIVSADASNLNKMLALKHRVAVMSLSELSKDKEKAAILFNSTDFLVYLRDEGVMMEREDWASVVDLIKSELSKSDFFRIVEISKTLSRKDIEIGSGDQPGLVVLVSFGIAGNERKIFARLLELSSGQTLFSTEAVGQDLRIAARNGLADLENWLLVQSWRCRVIGIRSSEMIINRGRLDGLREGVELTGYSLAKVPKGNRESEEAILLKYGSKRGTYTVVEVNNNYAKIKSSDGKRLLSEGDILEMPEVRLLERDVKTRGSRMWDKIYER